MTPPPRQGLVYTEEQQERLGVDENGDIIDTAAGDAAAAMAAGILDDVRWRTEAPAIDQCYR